MKRRKSAALQSSSVPDPLTRAAAASRSCRAESRAARRFRLRTLANTFRRGARSSAVFQGDAAGAPTSFTVTASAPGLAPASATVQLSVDPADSVMQVAAASVALADLGQAD